jgi:hypothetical protein
MYIKQVLVSRNDANLLFFPCPFVDSYSSAPGDRCLIEHRSGGFKSNQIDGEFTGLIAWKGVGSGTALILGCI